MRSAAQQVALAAYHGLGRVGRRALGVHVDPYTWPVDDVPPWVPLAPTDGAQCNLCRWAGDAFDDPGHVELTRCPRCGSNGRDRFMHWCLSRRVALGPGLRIIECSPRMGAGYRGAMSSWFFYRTSDYDLSAHRGNLQLDLQNIDLPDACLDVLLCAHVLEHVPDTDKALAEIRRVLVPGGHLLLQVPVLQGRTAPPTEPEFHGDDTPVFWRFGFDLTTRLRDHGFVADLLCTADFADAVASQSNPWSTWAGEFDVPDLLDGARADGVSDDLVVVADEALSARLGFEPAYQYLTWDCRSPV
jgi:SAM-dependent methyltransferase